MKTLAALALILMLLESECADATLVVYDPVNHGTAVFNELTNIVQWVETEVHSAATELNTLNTYEQEVLQVARMGDPQTLTANIPGVQNIQTLEQIYTQAERDINDWSSFVNPQSWRITADQILDIYGQQGFNGFTAANGIHIGAAQSLINFQVSNYNIDKGAQQTVATLNQKLAALTQQLAAATNAMESSTTQSQVQKYQSVINALHASIDATNGALQQARFSVQLQTQQNNAAQTISQNMTLQKAAAEAYQAIDAGSGMTDLPSQNFRQLALWPN